MSVLTVYRYRLRFRRRTATAPLPLPYCDRSASDPARYGVSSVVGRVYSVDLADDMYQLGVALP